MRVMKILPLCSGCRGHAFRLTKIIFVDRVALQRAKIRAVAQRMLIKLNTQTKERALLEALRSPQAIGKAMFALRPAFLALSLTLATPVCAQVTNNVPPIVPGAKPVVVEHIKVHGAALEGSLEGDSADRDVPCGFAVFPSPPTRPAGIPWFSGLARLFHRRRAMDA